MDFGGREGGGTASGVIDGVGYLGGVAEGGRGSLTRHLEIGGSSSKSRQTKCAQLDRAFSINDQFRHRFANRCRMFETVTRAG